MIIVTTSSGRHWQSNTETVLAPVLRRQQGGTRGCAGGIACSLGAGRGTVWPLSLDGCWTSASAGGCSFLQGAGLCGVPLAHPAPVPRERAVCAPGAAAVLGCGAQPCRSTCKLWLFLYIFRFIFLLFWQQTYPSRCPGESKTVHGGLLPCQPLTQGSEPLRGRDCGQEPDLCPPAEPNPLAGVGNLG